MLVGVISDTHGLLRPEALLVLKGVDHILHAGDVGDPAILDVLRTIAPLTAIRGNIDVAGACIQLPATELIDLAGHSIYMLHNLRDLDLDPATAGISVVISGHTHQPRIDRRKGIVYFNPGSAGPRRFSLPVSLGMLDLGEDSLTPRIIEIL
jgi:hypothetical protein